MRLQSVKAAIRLGTVERQLVRHGGLRVRRPVRIEAVRARRDGRSPWTTVNVWWVRVRPVWKLRKARAYWVKLSSIV